MYLVAGITACREIGHGHPTTRPQTTYCPRAAMGTTREAEQAFTKAASRPGERAMSQQSTPRIARQLATRARNACFNCPIQKVCGVGKWQRSRSSTTHCQHSLQLAQRVPGERRANATPGTATDERATASRPRVYLNAGRASGPMRRRWWTAGE